MEPSYPGDYRHPAVYPDIRPHAAQLVYMAVPAIKHILHKHGGPLPPSQGGHQDGLPIGRETGIGRGTHSWDALKRPPALQQNVVRSGSQAAARLLQRTEHRGKRLGLRPGQLHLSSGGGRRA